MEKMHIKKENKVIYKIYTYALWHYRSTHLTILIILLAGQVRDDGKEHIIEDAAPFHCQVCL
jgi:hypothetical protein